MTWWYLEHCFTLNLTATKSALQEVLSAASAAFLDYRPLRTMASDWWQQYFGPCRRTSNRFTQADHLHVLRIDHINHIGVAETGWLEKKAGLVGGLEHFYFSIYWECHHPNWLYLCNIFQGGRSTTNQRTSSIFFVLAGTAWRMIPALPSTSQCQDPRSPWDPQRPKAKGWSSPFIPRFK